MSPRPAIFWTLSLAAASLFASAARAELILDDFDDPASVVSPEMVNEYVDTTGVGELAATRSIRIFGLGASPEGRIDVNAGGSSAYVASLDALNATPSPLSKFASVQFDYFFARPENGFATADVTSGGSNNAIVLEFSYLTSAAIPRFFRVIVQDASGTSYESSIVPVPLSDTRNTLAFPFDSFQLRGGGVGLPEFSSLRLMYFTLRVVSGSGPADLEFRMSLDRIAFDRIPESATSTPALLSLLALIVIRRTRIRRNHVEGCSHERRAHHVLDRLGSFTGPWMVSVRDACGYE